MKRLTMNPWVAGAVALGLFAACGLALGHRDARAGTRDVLRPNGTVTFAKDVAPIIYNNCTSCHRAGEVAPFALSNYQDVKKRATQIASVVQSHYMPPWHADSHGEFQNERRLTDDQVAVLQQWVQGGAKPGVGTLPEPPKFASGWTLGEPDLVLQPSKSYALKAEGTDIYRCFVLPNANTEDKYVTAMEVRPGNAKVVHHVIAYLNADGKARAKEEANTDGQPGYTSFGGIGTTPSGFLGGWAPGNFPRKLPDGIGTPFPKGSDIVLQVHYHPSGKAETDQTRVGIYYCKKPVDKQLRVYPVIARLNIPAGEANYQVTSFQFPIPWDATVLEVMPHMHLLGKEMAITVTSPEGEQKSLVNVPHYDFSWQTTYVYKKPVKIAKGSKIGLTARYDNSTSNPRNPSTPPRSVGWGEQTTDEMCIGFVYFTLDDEHITQGKKMGPFGFGTGRRASASLLKRLFQSGALSSNTSKSATSP